MGDTSPKPCRWCDGKPDYRIVVANETNYACSEHKDVLMNLMEGRHSKRALCNIVHLTS